MVGARWNRLDGAIFSVCLRSVFWANNIKNIDFFSSKKIDVYCMDRFSKC